MTVRVADYLPQKINQYVPNMTYAADVVMEGPVYVALGAIAALDVNGILLAQDMTAAGEATSFETAYSRSVMGPFGRSLTIDCDGASTSEISIYGRDYLGQPMVETVDLNGTTQVELKKAFAWIERITWEAVAQDLIVGWNDVLGLPYNTQALAHEMYNAAGAGFVVAGTGGTFAAAVVTDPATAALGDVRGTVLPNDAPDGTKQYAYYCIVDRSNLHGVAQFFA